MQIRKQRWGGPRWQVTGMRDNSWKAGRDNSCTTKENEERVCVKPGHCILKNASIEFIIFTKRYVLHKWQWFITGPRPHESCKSERIPSAEVSISTACNDWRCRALRTAWSHSNSSRPAGPARLFKASSSNQKLSSDRRHKISRASRGSCWICDVQR